MKAEEFLTQDVLLNALLKHLDLPNDRALSEALGISAPILSKIRNGKNIVSASVLVIMHEHSGLAIKRLRELMNDHRPHTGTSAGPLPPLPGTQTVRHPSRSVVRRASAASAQTVEAA